MQANQPQVYADIANALHLIKDTMQDTQSAPNLDNLHHLAHGLLSQVIAYLLAWKWEHNYINEWANPQADLYLLNLMSRSLWW